MPAAVWPLTLPQTLLAKGTAESMEDIRLHSRTDTGPGKMRPLSSREARRLVGAMVMTATQIDALIEFVNDELAKGSLPFTFPSPRGGADWLVRFSKDGLPQWSVLEADKYTVNFTLELL